MAIRKHFGEKIESTSARFLLMKFKKGGLSYPIELICIVHGITE
jgi:hypothetical protein